MPPLGTKGLAVQTSATGRRANTLVEKPLTETEKQKLNDGVPVEVPPANPPRHPPTDGVPGGDPPDDRFHSAAGLFPLMSEAELKELADDIQKHGLREPIVTYRGMVLDGRNRLAACRQVNVEPRFVEWDGHGSPVAFVLSRNLHRRHLTQSQRAAIAAEALPLFEEEAKERQRLHGGTAPGQKAETLDANRRGKTSADRAGESLGVSGRSVARAHRIQKASPEKFGEVKDGKKTVHRAEQELRGNRGIVTERGFGAREAFMIVELVRFAEGHCEGLQAMGGLDALHGEYGPLAEGLEKKEDAGWELAHLVLNQAHGLAAQDRTERGQEARRAIREAQNLLNREEA